MFLRPQISKIDATNILRHFRYKNYNEKTHGQNAYVCKSKM